MAQPLTIALGNAAFTVGQTALANISTSPAVTGKITLTTKSTLPAGVTFHDNGNGTGKLSGKPAANQNGTYPITITATNGGLATSQTFTLAVAATSPLPTFNVSSVTFTAKVGSTSAVLTSPANARVTEKGALPTGVSLKVGPNGTTLSGTPGPKAGGNYPITLTATNGGASASEMCTVTVDQALAITSMAGTTFATGQTGSFTVTATGFPYAQWSLANVPSALAGMLDLADNQNGTATLSALLPPGIADTFQFNIVATNSVGSTSQRFTLTVKDSPIFTSSTSATFSVNQPIAPFTIQTIGMPTATLTYAGTLPSGLKFKNNLNGTATLSGTPTHAGTYRIVITATNDVAPAALQLLTLVIQ